MTRKVLVLVLLATAAPLSAATAAQAAFPGSNGKVAFDRPVPRPGGGTDFHVFTIDPDGTGERSITTPGASDTNPSWSADGRRLAVTSFSLLTTMDADGADRTTL